MTEGHLVDGNLGDTLDGLERDEKRVLIHDGKILAQQINNTSSSSSNSNNNNNNNNLIARRCVISSYIPTTGFVPYRITPLPRGSIYILSYHPIPAIPPYAVKIPLPRLCSVYIYRYRHRCRYRSTYRYVYIRRYKYRYRSIHVHVNLPVVININIDIDIE